MEGKKILVVEDDLNTATLLDSLLKKNGYNVVLAHNGKMALLLIKAMKPDLIVTDVIMPEMNGYEFYKSVRKNADTKDVPMIVLSGRKDIGNIFSELDIDCFFHKPIDLTQFLEKIKTLLTKGRDKTERDTGDLSSRGDLFKNKYFWIAVVVGMASVFGMMMYIIFSQFNAIKSGDKKEIRSWMKDGEVIVAEEADDEGYVEVLDQ